MTAPGIPPTKAIGEAVVGTAAEAAHALFPAVIGPPGSGPPPTDEFVLDPKFKDLAGDPTVHGGQIPVDLQKSTELTGKPSGSTRTGYLGLAEQPIVAPGEAGGGGGGLSGSVSGTVGPPIPGELVAAQQAYAANSAMIEKLGYQARFDALGLVVDVEGEIDELWRADFKGTSKRMRSMLDEAEEEVSGIRDFMEAARSDQINSGEFFANIGGAGRFGAAMALGAGAMATAFGGGPNAALQIITQAIDRNIRAQVANQTHNRALIAHQNNFVNTLRGLAGDEMQYANFLRIGYTAMAKNRVAKITAAYGQAQAKLGFQDVDNKLGARLAEAEIRALTAAQQKVTFNFKNIAQYSKSLKLLDGASPVGRGGGGTGTAIASRRVRGGDAKQLPSASPAQGAVQQGAAEAPVRLTNIEELKTDFKRFSNTHTDQEVAKLQKDTVAKLRASGDAVTADSLERLGRTSLISNRKAATVGIGVAGFQAGAIPGPRFQALKGESPAKAISEVSAAATMYEYVQDVSDLLEHVNFESRSTLLKSFRTYGDERLALPARDPRARAMLNEITLKILEIQEFNRKAEGTRNALDKIHEMVRAAQRTSSNVSVAELMTDVWMNSPELRQMSFSSVIPVMKDKLRAAQEKWDLRLVSDE